MVKTGIEAIAFYVPKLYVSMDNLANARGIEAEKLKWQLLNLVLPLVLLGVFGVIIIFLRHQYNASSFQIFSYILITLLFGVYVSYTMCNAHYSNSELFVSNASYKSLFEFIFPMSYGFFQFIGGYIISSYGFIGYILFALFF